MEGFEIINKYNERCLAWRVECAKLLGDWAMAGDDTDAKFVEETRTMTGFLCAAGGDVKTLLLAVTQARIEHVILALRYLRARQQPSSKPTCNFCTRLAEKGEHVAGCIGKPPRCECFRFTGDDNIIQQCLAVQGHGGEHTYVTHTAAQQ